MDAWFLRERAPSDSRAFLCFPLLRLEQEKERGERRGRAGGDGTREGKAQAEFSGQILASLRRAQEHTEDFCAHRSFPRLGKTPPWVNKPSQERSCRSRRSFPSERLANHSRESKGEGDRSQPQKRGGKENFRAVQEPARSSFFSALAAPS